MHYEHTGLLVHGYDETRTQLWANQITGACTYTSFHLLFPTFFLIIPISSERMGSSAR